jgi:hypothetical protein
MSAPTLQTPSSPPHPPSRNNIQNNTDHRKTPKRNITLYLSLTLCLSLPNVEPRQPGEETPCFPLPRTHKTHNSPRPSVLCWPYDLRYDKKRERRIPWEVPCSHLLLRLPNTPYPYLPTRPDIPRTQKRESPSLENKTPLRWHACSKQAATEIRSKKRRADLKLHPSTHPPIHTLDAPPPSLPPSTPTIRTHTHHPPHLADELTSPRQPQPT